MHRIILLAFAIAFGVILPISIAHPQQNPFNPDLQWCNVQGSIATRTATKWQCLQPGLAGQVLQSGGPAANASWLTTAGSGTVTSVAATVPSFMAVSGSPITAAGTLGFSFNSQAANLHLSSPDGAPGVPSFRALALGDIPVLTAAKLPNAGVMTGDVTTTFPAVTIGAGAVTGGKIASGTVANSNLAKMAATTIKSNLTGGAAAPADNTGTAVIDALFGSTQGAILYRNASVWTLLGPGTTGEFLKTNGAAANPQWAGVPGASGGTVTSVTCGSGLTGGTFTLAGTCAFDTGALPGVANNSAAAAGKVGQEIASNVLQASAIAISSQIPLNLTSISLTAGDWDISAVLYYRATGTITSTYSRTSISTTSATQNLVSPMWAGRGVSWSLTSGDINTLVIPPTRISVNSTTTYYLVFDGNQSGAGTEIFGNLRARRMR